MSLAKHIILWTCLLGALNAQAQRLSAWLDAADKAMAGGNYYAAIEYYRTALQIEPDNLDIQYRLAEAARRFGAWALADSMYHSVRVADTTGAFPDAVFFEAEANQRLGRFDRALSLYDQYLQADTSALDPAWRRRAEKARAHCLWAGERIYEIEEGIVVLPLPEGVGDARSDFAPVQRPNGALYFSSFRAAMPADDHYPARPLIQVYQWDPARRDLPPQRALWNRRDRHTAHAAFSPSGKYLFFTLCDYVGEANIRCELWRLPADSLDATPQRLPDTINLPGFTATEPALGFVEAWQKEVLFFVSDRPGGRGGLDIWYAPIDAEGMPGIPVPLEAVNTPGDDITPFFHTPTQTLYFSTNGRPTLGGLDIYAAPLDATGQWGEPIHQPPPLNSTYDEAWYWQSEAGGSGWFASNRPGSMVLDEGLQVCCFDLYQMLWRELDVLLSLRNDKTGAGLPDVHLRVWVSTDSVPILLTEWTRADSVQHLPLEKGRTYVLQLEKEGFYPQTDTIDLTQPELEALRQLERLYLMEPDHLELFVRAFDAETGTPLEGVEFRVVDEEGFDVAYFASEQGNQGYAVVPRGHKYLLLSSKIGYVTDTTIIDLPALGNPYVLERNVVLQPKRIEDFPPIILYFDNDQPDPGSHSRRTDKTYEEMYVQYFKRKPLFIDEYVKVLQGQDRMVAAERIEVFFDREVANGYENLKLFSDLVLEALEKGLSVELIIKGYASPLGDERYNEILAQRRVAVLENHFKTYRNGAFLPYLQSGQFKLTRVAYGERLAPQYISDSARNERESVYSVAASLERRVEIIGVKLGPFKKKEQ